MNKELILVACAMKREARLLINRLECPVESSEKGFKFFEGRICDKNIIIGISGPGLVNMSSMISIAILKWGGGSGHNQLWNGWRIWGLRAQEGYCYR